MRPTTKDTKEVAYLHKTGSVPYAPPVAVKIKAKAKAKVKKKMPLKESPEPFDGDSSEAGRAFLCLFWEVELQRQRSGQGSSGFA